VQINDENVCAGHLSAYLDDSEEDGAEMNGEQQQLAGEQVPDPADQPFLPAGETWSALLACLGAGQLRHLCSMVDPIPGHVRRPTL